MLAETDTKSRIEHFVSRDLLVLAALPAKERERERFYSFSQFCLLCVIPMLHFHTTRISVAKLGMLRGKQRFALDS